MNTLRLHSLCAIAIATSASVATADLRVFIVEAGVVPNDHVLGTPEIIFAEPGAVVSLELFLVDGETNVGILAYQWMIPCAGSRLDGAAGSVEYVDPSIWVNPGRPDFIFVGLSILPAADPGNCPVGGVPGNPRWGMAIFGFPRHPPVVGETPVYLGEFQYYVTQAATGDHEIQMQCIPTDGCTSEQTFLRGNNSSGMPFENLQKDAAIIRTTCTADEQCDNGSICTVDTCEASGSCLHAERIYGDVDESGLVDLDDVLCAVAGFVNLADCPGADIGGC